LQICADAWPTGAAASASIAKKSALGFIDFFNAMLREVEAGERSSAELPHWHRRGYGRASSMLRRRT